MPTGAIRVLVTCFAVDEIGGAEVIAMEAVRALSVGSAGRTFGGLVVADVVDAPESFQAVRVLDAGSVETHVGGALSGHFVAVVTVETLAIQEARVARAAIGDA